MQSKKVKQLAAKILNCGTGRVWFSPTDFEKIKSAMTKEDIKELIKQGVIKKKKINCQSRGRARILKKKKARGRKKGFGARRGRKKARTETKKRWMKRVRAMRSELKKLRKENPKAVEKIGYRKLYKMVKGNFFKGKKYVAAFVEGKKTKR
ncbi:MAG: 50S ribosomal protein L19e [Candidatus Diapherotrites archaeon]|nr:50S ribosomal protein L19e [Candidatus Diapherotrites archaeon]